MKSERNIALILAGGYGRRAKAECPKQFVEIDGHSILAYTAAAFQHHEQIDEFYVVCTDEWSERINAEMRSLGYGKFSGTFPAGATSIDSLHNGVDGLTAKGLSPQSIVLVHEAVRPVVSEDIITDALAVCGARGNAIAGIESYESYMKSPTGIVSNEMQSRYGLFRAQTPHTFPLGSLQQVFVLAMQRGIHTSQSLFTLVSELGLFPLYISRGEQSNLKITLPEDLKFFESLIKGGYIKL